MEKRNEEAGEEMVTPVLPQPLAAYAGCCVGSEHSREE